MEFMNAYKHLEKLCGDILNDERRISAYIDEMAKFLMVLLKYTIGIMI